MSKRLKLGRKFLLALVTGSLIMSVMVMAPPASAWIVSSDTDALLIAPDNNPRTAICRGDSSQSTTGYGADGAQQFSIEDSLDRYIRPGCENWDAWANDEVNTSISASGKTVMMARQSLNAEYNDRIRIYDTDGSFLWEYAAKDECGQPASITARPVVNGSIAAYIHQSCNTGYIISGIDIDSQQLVFSHPLGSVSNSTHLSWYTGGFTVNDLPREDIRFISFNGSEDTTKKISGPWQSYFTMHTDGTVVYTSKIYDGSSKCYINFDYVDQPVVKREIVCDSYDDYVSFAALPNGDVVAASRQEDENDNGHIRIIHQSNIPDTLVTVQRPSKTRSDSFSLQWLMVDANGKIIVGSFYQEAIGEGPYGDVVTRTAVDVLDQQGTFESRWLSSSLGDDSFRPYGKTSYQLANGAIYLFDGIGNRVEKIVAPNVSLSYRDSVRWNIPPVAVTQPLNYVALGDSFSSGEGVEPFITGTDEASNKCHRSELAYPKLLAMDPSLNISLTDFVACSGATVNDVFGFSELGDPHGKWNENAQLDTLSSDTDIVTITIGGNDVGFGDYVSNCTTSLCGSGTAPYNTITGNIASPAFADDLESTYQTILSEAPNAELHVVNYPYLSAENAGMCGVVDFSGARDVQELLNYVISGAVHDVSLTNSRIHLVDTNATGSPFIGKHYCNGGETSFNGLDAINPEHSFHPNQQGQEDYATVVKDAID